MFSTAAVLLGAAAFLGKSRFRQTQTPKATVAFVPLGRLTNAGSIQQLFAVSNLSWNPVMYVMGRSRVTSEGHTVTNGYEALTPPFQLAPHSETQVALSLPSDETSWRGALLYQRIVSTPELELKKVGYRSGLVQANEIFPGWQTITTEIFKR